MGFQAAGASRKCRFGFARSPGSLGCRLGSCDIFGQDFGLALIWFDGRMVVFSNSWICWPIKSSLLHPERTFNLYSIYFYIFLDFPWDHQQRTRLPYSWSPCWSWMHFDCDPGPMWNHDVGVMEFPWIEPPLRTGSQNTCCQNTPCAIKHFDTKIEVVTATGNSKGPVDFYNQVKDIGI